MRRRDIVLAAFGWCCAGAFALELALGRGKSTADYAVRWLPPLAVGDSVTSSDDAHLIWSGWTRWKAEGRTSIAADPDIVFTSSVARSDCDVIVSATPALPDGLRAQRIMVALNGSASPDDASMTTSGAYRFTKLGNIRIGANRLSLRFPDARKLNIDDEHLGAIDLRSIAIACASD